MWLFNFKILFVLVLFIASKDVQANEGAKPEGHGEAAGSSAVSPEYSGKQDDSWMKLQTELVTDKTKLDAEQAIVTDLLLSKKNNKGRIGKDQVDQLNEHHKKLQEMIKDYNQKLSDFENKHPEKGQAFGRQYKRKKEQSLDQMENSLTLDGRIRKVNQKIKAQFEVVEESKPQKKNDSENNSSVNTKTPENASNKTKPKPDITEKIILVK